MKINVVLVCNDKEESKRGNQMICDIIGSAFYDDIVNANMYVCADDLGGLKSKLSIKMEDKHAEE